MQDLNFKNDGIVRTKERIKKNGEVATPFEIVDRMIAKIPEEKWKEPAATFIDPCAGNGQILVRMLQKRLDSGISKEDAVKTLYGVELMQDNRDLAVKRILEIVGPKYRNIVEHNIVCSDFFNWDFENWCPKTEPVYDGGMDEFLI